MTEDGQERPDVDIIIVTNFKTTDSPETVLQTLSEALDGEFTVERINKRSVRVTDYRAEIDVVPVTKSGAYYELSDRDLGHWRATNPPGHTTWSATQNRLFGERFKPLVKMLKWWRRQNPSGKRPKGFVLEVLVSKHAPREETHYGEAFAKTLENIYSSYRYLADLGLKPTIEDPGLPGSDILSKVSVTDWRNFIDRMRVHAEYAMRAQTTEDMEEATRLWRKLFGDRFKPTVAAARAAAMMSSAVAPTAGRTFPNQPVTPPNKPRGFA
jgi:hypothetical protein